MGLWPLVIAGAELVAPVQPQGVSGGREAQTCQFPTVVTFRSGGQKCTGTLVHPEVIVTAAHCLGDKAGNIHFGEYFILDAMRVESGACHRLPAFEDDPHPRNDLGVCRLAEPVEGIPATPLLVGCRRALEPGLPATIVGFGPSAAGEDFGTKHYAETVIAAPLRSDGLIEIGEASVGGCEGDSGGPVFVLHPDGSWRMAGVLVYGPPCGEGPSLYRVVDDQVGWMEAVTGVDLTPCHDADGSWQPTENCGGFALDPAAVGAVWADRCAGELSGPSMACIEGETGTSTGEDGGTAGSSTGEASSSEASGEESRGEAEEEEGCGCGRGNERSTGMIAWLLAIGWTRARPRAGVQVRRALPLAPSRKREGEDARPGGGDS